MQGQRSIFDPFPEAVDLNQGSNSNNTRMDESDDWNMLSSMERRLFNNDLSNELNFSCMNTNDHHNFQSFSSWDVGESSSRASLQDQALNDNLKVEQNWSSTSTHDSRLEDQLESSTIQSNDNLINGHVSVVPTNMQSSVSNQTPMNVNLNVGYRGGDNDDEGMRFMDLYKSGRPETEASALSAGWTSSECGPSSSLGSWGLSCKRKALEGTSGQSLSGGSSSCFPQAEDIPRRTVPICSNASSSLNTSSPSLNPVPLNRHEQPSTRTGIAMRILGSNSFPSSSVTGVPESSQTHFNMRGSVPYNTSMTGNPTRHPSIGLSRQSSGTQVLPNELLDRTSRGPIGMPTNSSNPSSQQPQLMHVTRMPRNANHFPWGSNISSRIGGSSTSPVPPLERGSEANFRSFIRNNMQHHNFVSSPETRNSVQDPTSWSLATGSASTNAGGTSSNSRNGIGSDGSRLFNAVGTPQHNNPTTQSQQRSSEFPPWTLFPSADVESGSQRGHIPPFSAGSSSNSERNNMSSGIASYRRRYQPFSRSALSTEVPIDGWHAFATDLQGRHRLVFEIRQVLNAMQRGDNLRAEDHMLLDPFINGMAELHDIHRELRLDVDNMSYEELLALEERIGNVNTGLSEEVILKSLKQRKHIAFMAISTQNMEPCCICQEEYDTGDNIGSLDCGHDFHTDCIKQWLAQKNVCPICKMSGLSL